MFIGRMIHHHYQFISELPLSASWYWVFLKSPNLYIRADPTSGQQGGPGISSNFFKPRITRLDNAGLKYTEIFYNFSLPFFPTSFAISFVAIFYKVCLGFPKEN